MNSQPLIFVVLWWKHLNLLNFFWGRIISVVVSISVCLVFVSCEMTLVTWQRLLSVLQRCVLFALMLRTADPSHLYFSFSGHLCFSRACRVSEGVKREVTVAIFCPWDHLSETHPRDLTRALTSHRYHKHTRVKSTWCLNPRFLKRNRLLRNNGRNVYWESNLLVRKQRILSGVIVVLCTDVRSAAALVQLLSLAGFSRANMNVRDGVRPQKHRFNASHFNYLSYSFSARALARAPSPRQASFYHRARLKDNKLQL